MAKTEEGKLRPTVQPVRRGQEEAEAAPKGRVAPSPAAQQGQKIPSGVPGMDALLGGGYERTSTTLVMGGAGCGKTTFLAQFLHSGAVEHNEPGVLLSFEESAGSVLKHMNSFGMDFAALEKQDMFASISYRPHEVRKLIEEGGGLILDTISSLGAKRLAIDSLTSYIMMYDTPYQAREAELSLFELLRKWECTTLLSAEGLPNEKVRKTAGMEYLADGVIVMHHPRSQATRFRAIEVLKMRGGKANEKLCPFEFVEGVGIKVYPNESVFYDIKDE